MNEEQKTMAAIASANEFSVLNKDFEPRPLDTKLPRTVNANVAAVLSDRVVAPAVVPTTAAVEQPAIPLFSSHEAKEFRVRWDAIQGGFVDEPRFAVEHADTLVAETMKRMAEMFSAERTKLEGQWDRDGGASTEDLRLALRRYRSFFDRILAV